MMMRTSTTLIRLSIAALVGSAALLWSGELPLNSQSSLVTRPKRGSAARLLR